MKKNLKIVTLLFAMIIVASCGNNTRTDTAAKSEEQAAANKKIPFERGSYVETTNTMGMEINKTTYFDKWGEWEAIEEKSEIEIMKGRTSKTDKLIISKGKGHWNIDMVKKTGTYSELDMPASGMAAAMGAATGGKMMEGTEIKDLGMEKYLGYDCKKAYVKYTQMDMEVTVLSYGNLTMKMDGHMGKVNISSKVTSIDLGAPPASVFEVPADITIEKQ
jgi:hypothetical protein